MAAMLSGHGFTFSHRIMLVRTHMGLDLTDFAWLLEISPATYRAYESGHDYPDMRELGRIASRTGAPKEWLMGIGDTFPWGG